MSAEPIYALSIKQPWAALVVGGLKTVEVRRWPTARRGRVLIHAARIPDERDDAWKHVPEHLHALAQLQGGVIGAAELKDCKKYADLATFLRDQKLHLNEAHWFAPPLLYGFAFAKPEVVPFQRYKGWFKFFRVQQRAPLALASE